MLRYYACQKGLGKFNALKRAIRAKNGDDAVGILTAAACYDELQALIRTMKTKGFKSFSLGVSGTVKLAVASGSGEYFIATDLDLKNPTLYAQVGGSLGLQAGASVNGVVTAHYGTSGSLQGSGSSLSASFKAFGGAGGTVGLSTGKAPRCTSFSVAAGIGAEADAGSVGKTYTAKLFSIPKPDFTPGCKNVYVKATNRTGKRIKIVDVDFYDTKQKRWRSKIVSNQEIPPGEVWARTMKLQKVGGDETQLRI